MYSQSNYEDVYYRIVPRQNTIHFFEHQSPEELYNNREDGFLRSAKSIKDKRAFKGESFKDYDFSPPPLNNIRYMRLYDLYDIDGENEGPLFPPGQQYSSYIDEQEKYNSFLAETGVISYKHLQSLFITQVVNSAGYYQYFVKRNGEYFVQECDDLVPIDIKTRKPIWGLSLKHPWQLILLKAWLKEMGTWQALHDAQPFRFLDSFGLPSYKTFNFMKQAQFLKKQKTSMARKEENMKNFTLNNKNVIIIAQTINNPKLWDVGLVPGVAAYRMVRVSEQNGKQPFYRLYSSLPCRWVGKMTPVQNTELNKLSVKKYLIDLERNFIITEQQALNYFSKCYVVPKELVMIENYQGQDCMSFVAQRDKQIWLKFQSKEKSEGLLAISIEMPWEENRSKRYPQIRYFLSKKNTADQISKSHLRNDIRASKSRDNMFVQSNCDKWQEYRIGYHQGYHHSSPIYTKLEEGEYVFYIQFSQDTEFKLRFDTQVNITRPQVIYPDDSLGRTIFDSTFFDVSQSFGIQTSFSKKDFNETIRIADSFDEVGFGAVVITTLKDARHKVAMRVFPEKLKEAGYDFCENFYGSIKANQSASNIGHQAGKGLVFISQKGRPQIIVLRRIDKNIVTMIERDFPPPGTIQFFKVTPEVAVDKPLSKSKRKK